MSNLGDFELRFIKVETSYKKIVLVLNGTQNQPLLWGRYLVWGGSELKCLSSVTSALWFQQLYYVDDIPDPTWQTSQSLPLVLYCLIVILCWRCKDFWHIEWWIHVILLQLLICIVAFPPGNINHYAYSSVNECLLFVIVTKLQ